MIGTGVLLLLFGGQVIFMIKFFFFSVTIWVKCRNIETEEIKYRHIKYMYIC